MRSAHPHAGLTELPGELAERRALDLAGAGIGQQAQCFAGEARARRRPTVQLRHDGAPEREVREAHPRDADQQAREQLAHERQAVADDHRRAEQRGLQRHGAGGDEQQIGRADDCVRPAIDDLHGRTAVEVMRGEAPLDRGRQAEHEPSSGRGGQYLRRGIPHYREHANDLLVPATRQEPDHGRPVVDPEAPARRLAGRRRLQLVEQGMPDELHGHSDPAVQRRLEREHREHERDKSPDRFHPAATPRPHLRRNEVHDRDAGAPRGSSQAKIELRKVDQDEHCGTVGAAEDRTKPAVGAVEARHLTDRLAPAHDGGSRHVYQKVHSRGGHLRPAHPEEPAARVEPAQGPTQSRAVKVAGGFPGDEHDRRRPGDHHSTPTRAIPAPFAMRRHSSLSRTKTRSASTATTVAPPAAATSMVSGPTPGVSNR